MRTILSSAAFAALLIASGGAHAFIAGHDTGGEGNQGAYSNQNPGDSGHDAGDNSGSGSDSKKGKGPLYPGSGSGDSQGYEGGGVGAGDHRTGGIINARTLSSTA